MEQIAPTTIFTNAPCANDQLNETNAVASNIGFKKSALPSGNGEKEQQNIRNERKKRIRNEIIYIEELKSRKEIAVLHTAADEEAKQKKEVAKEKEQVNE